MDSSEALRQRHEALKQRVAEDRMKALEAQTRLKALEEREAEVVGELAALGITKPEELDAYLAQEEQAIAAELAAIEQALERPATTQAVGPPAPQGKVGKPTFLTPLERTPDGRINNCAFQNTGSATGCQVCGGVCPDQVAPGATGSPISLDDLLNATTS